MGSENEGMHLLGVVHSTGLANTVVPIQLHGTVTCAESAFRCYLCQHQENYGTC